MPKAAAPGDVAGAEPHPGLVTWQCYYCGKKVDVRIQLKTPKSFPYRFWSYSPSGWVHAHGDDIVACSKECAENVKMP